MMNSFRINPRLTKVAIALVALIAAGGSYAANPNDLPPVPAEAHTVAAAATYGEYQYQPQQGVYQGLNFGDALEDTSDFLTNVGGSFRYLNQALGWGSYHGAGRDGEGLSWRVGGNLGTYNASPPGFGIGYGDRYYAENGYNRLSVMLGPLKFDQFTVGYGALYTDVNGDVPGAVADDGWAQIVWLSMRASLVIGDSFGISISPILYWLPEKNEVGWGIPGPFGFWGLQLPQAGINGLAEIMWTEQFGNWRITVYDTFSPMFAPYDIWDVGLFSPTQQNGWSDLTPIDRVGRYGLGYGAADVSSYDIDQNSQRTRFGFGDGDYNSDLRFFNVAGARAIARHGSSTTSLLYFNRFDNWDSDFRGVYSGIEGGAYLQNSSPNLLTYAGYNFTSGNPYELFYHWAVVGAQRQLSANLTGYVEGGYYWTTGDVADDSGWLATAGLVQRLGPYTMHMIEGGRRVFHPGNQDPGIEDYAEYRITHQLGSRTNAAAFAGFSERHIRRGTLENDYNVKYAGAVLNTQLTDRVTAMALAGWEEIEIEESSVLIDRWTYRLGLLAQFTTSLQGQCYYQYEDVHGTQNYSEHVLYLGLAKSF